MDEHASSQYKTPPHDDQAEKSVLGAILIDSSAVALVAEYVRPYYFYSNAHRLIYISMLALFEDQSPIDIVTLKNQLSKDGTLKAVGGASYLSDLLNSVPTSAYVEQYGQIVKSMYTKRKLIDIASRSVEKAFGEKETSKNLLMMLSLRFLLLRRSISIAILFH